MTELDIWRSADILMRRYKSKALLRALKRADELLAQNDKAGWATWASIAKMIMDLERKAPHQGEPVN